MIYLLGTVVLLFVLADIVNAESPLGELIHFFAKFCAWALLALTAFIYGFQYLGMIGLLIPLAILCIGLKNMRFL